METAEIGSPAKNWSLKRDGSAENPADFMEYLRSLMVHLTQCDPELANVVERNDMEKLQQLFLKRRSYCHCRAVVRFNHFLEFFHEKFNYCCWKGKIKADVETRLRESVDLTNALSPQIQKRVVGLNINIKVNGHVVEAAICTGSYSTIISEEMAAACRIEEHVGCQKNCSVCEITIGNTTCSPCSLLVVDLSSTKFHFIIGLDMLQNLKSTIDLEKMVFKMGEDTVDIQLEEVCAPLLADLDIQYTPIPVLAQPIHRRTAGSTRPCEYKHTYGFNEDGFAKNPIAFRDQLRKNSVLMAKLFQLPNLAAAVLGNDIEELQQVLRSLYCDCFHCIVRFLFRQFEDFKNFNDYREFAKQHHGVLPVKRAMDGKFARQHNNNANLDVPYVRLIAGYGYSCEALVDTAAQSTMISNSLFEQIGLLPHLNYCYETCDGGHSKLVGKVDCSFIKFDKVFYPCPAIVVDNSDLGFVFGLDMLLKLKCILDFNEKVLKVGDNEQVPLVFKRGFDDDCQHTRCSVKRRRIEQISGDPCPIQVEANRMKMVALKEYFRAEEFEAKNALETTNWDIHEAVIRLCMRRVDPDPVHDPDPDPDPNFDPKYTSDRDHYPDSDTDSDLE